MDTRNIMQVSQIHYKENNSRSMMINGAETQLSISKDITEWQGHGESLPCLKGAASSQTNCYHVGTQA